MKKLSSFFAILLLVALTSCVSNKEMIYMQGADSTYASPRSILKGYELRIEPDDQLAISIDSKNPELITPFNNKTLIGSGSGSSINSSTSTANTSSGISYFYVDKDGFIDFPIFGKINVTGKTVDELSQYIQQRLINDKYIKDAIVTTRIMSFKITVLGDVKSPGTQNYTGERLTILEAIGRAGDLNNSAIRKNVLVIREENGKRVSYKIDLTKPESIFESPAYYLQQNDLVYIESNKSVKVKGSTSYTYLAVSGTLVGMVASVLSLIISLSN